MTLTENILKSEAFAKKINAINFDHQKISNLKSHKGQSRATVAIKLDNNEKYPHFLVEIDYKFTYEKASCIVELELVGKVDLKEKINSKPTKNEIDSLISSLNPSFDNIIQKINDIMGVTIPTLSKVTKRKGNQDGN